MNARKLDYKCSNTIIIGVNIHSISTCAAPIDLKTPCLEDIFQIRLVSGKREIRSMAYVEVFKKSHHSKRNIQSSFYFFSVFDFEIVFNVVLVVVEK